MKRRGIKDTENNRRILEDLGYTYFVSTNRNRVFIKVTNRELSIIKELLDDDSV
jgi:hypothetical protein